MILQLSNENLEQGGKVLIDVLPLERATLLQSWPGKENNHLYVSGSRFKGACNDLLVHSEGLTEQATEAIAPHRTPDASCNGHSNVERWAICRT